MTSKLYLFNSFGMIGMFSEALTVFMGAVTDNREPQGFIALLSL